MIDTPYNTARITAIKTRSSTNHRVFNAGAVDYVTVRLRQPRHIYGITSSDILRPEQISALQTWSRLGGSTKPLLAACQSSMRPSSRCAISPLATSSTLQSTSNHYPSLSYKSLGYDSEVLGLVGILPMLGSEIVWGRAWDSFYDIRSTRRAHIDKSRVKTCKTKHTVSVIQSRSRPH